MSDWSHENITLADVTLHVVLAGPEDGEPVILLHGFPEYWGGWRKQIPALAEAGYRVIVPDQRGYNLSEKPDDVKAYKMDLLAGDILGLMDHFKVSKGNVIGHDWGAAVAWWLAINHPNRVKKLGILNVPHPLVFAQTLRRSFKQMIKSWYILFFQLPMLPEAALNMYQVYRGQEKHYGAGLEQGIKGMSLPTTFSDDDMAQMMKVWDRGLTGMLNWYRAAVRHQPEIPYQPFVTMPSLVLWGEKDKALSFEMAEKSMRWCKNGRLITFPNASHFLQHDEPDAVNQHLLEFLAS